MKGKTYYTLVKYNHPVFGGNNYVRGVIMGMMTTICYGDQIGPVRVSALSSNHYLEITTTEARYRLFKERVEERYPGLCEFNVDMKKEN